MCACTGTRITLYEQLRAWWGAAASSSLAVKLLCGATAGAVGQLVAVPADLIKVQLQVDVRRVVSGQQQRRQFSGVRDVARSLMRQRGVAGMWTGGTPAVVRAALVNLGELSTYDSAKQAVLESGRLPDGLPTHLAASLCSGLVSAVVSCPADVVKTRLMAQQQQQQQAGQSASATGSTATQPAATLQVQHRASSSGRASISSQRHYTGMLDCAVSTVRQEGLTALYKGLLPTYLRLAPWQLVFWCSYEAMRGAAGLSTF